MKYPQIDPVFFHIGPLQFRWYGLMYIVGFVCAYFLLIYLSKRKGYDMEKSEIEDLVTYSVIGLVLGARLGYCIFYNPGYYIHHPLKSFAVWEGGMSFHGGLIGLVLAGCVFAQIRRKSFLMLADMGALAATPGLFFGRMGNFINAELYGRVTTMPWGMVFPGAGDFPRHPSQLYEAFSEGIILFLILFFLSRKVNIRGVLISSFLIFYGFMRFFLEFFREPDPQLGFVIGTFTMGQILCVLMVATGIILLINRLKSRDIPRDKTL